MPFSPSVAGAKQHGLHMPMSTDEVFARHFSNALAEKTDALIWPVLAYGYYPAFTAYAGSITLSDKTFRALVTEIADAILAFGAKRLLILDTGLSTIAPVDAAIAAMRNPSPIKHLRVFAGPRFKETVRNIQRQAYGTHADEIETSLMLVVAPELVDMTRARPCPVSPAGPTPGPLSPDDASSPRYAPSGSYGDPTLASAEKGERVRAAILADLLEAAGLA